MRDFEQKRKHAQKPAPRHVPGNSVVSTPAPLACGHDFSRILIHPSAVAADATAGVGAPFPHRTEIEASIGRPLTAVAHLGAGAVRASASLGTDAFAFGDHVGFADPRPSLFVAAHEAAHTVQDADSVRRHTGSTARDPFEAHADAVASRIVSRRSAADLLGDGRSSPAQAVRRFDGGKADDAPQATKAASARFEGDKTLEDIAAGSTTLRTGARGLAVTKLQQALIDLGYLLPKFGIDGLFESETKAAVLKFQKDQTLSKTGVLDATTIARLNALYDTLKPYVDKAAADPAHAGTRALSASDTTAATAAMVPPVGSSGAPSVFTDVVDGKGYGDEIQAELKTIISGFHKELFEDKAGLRADPAKNFHDWSTLEGPAKGAKQVTDAVYSSNYGGSAAFPPMTHAGGNLIDQWEDEMTRDAILTAPQKLDKATGKVWYLINSNCPAINKAHGAVPSAPTEKGILTPIVADLVSTPDKVQTMLDLEIGWEGAQLEGTVYLQLYKSTDPDKDKAKEKNRIQMWNLFHTCIHEYIHTLAHPAYQAWAQTFNAAGDATRYNTLIEGFCDFFTLNVRSTVSPDAALQATVEGPYANGQPPAAISSDVYSSHEQAEQVVSIVGIKNAQAAYFGGKTKLMGGP
ncbi:MAG TPA: peptidoglycan-binding protein [Thermoanaerobaculia bacterium]|jgi:hypothetical protein|nr:peptidoglycan-binding protein [Thermoanaerobaculia bacterium]